MFYVDRFYYPNGIEGENMKVMSKEFESKEKAIAYAKRYAKGVRFAGVRVEDEKGNLVFEITSDLEEFGTYL